ncbi:sugar-phosphate nucleotide transferase [Candidatus Magnetobacterium bavaricum]|uniref:Sugar-phosphate nucleotide transferase n=1 Tax=Candidatus Magnetobacterium bavaricum TaxID=29290 RepID=A0A0F3GTF7_9BACT|nr:sugar-phosphate nucleotide transferase [Candidatus Magnetobacterium bavaricum]
MSKRVIILAGGKGTRLLPYTVVFPKPLMPIGEFPILEVIIKQLARCGFDRITMAVNHHANIIKAFFCDGHKWGIKIDYSLEDKSLGTMGPLTLIHDLPDNFLVMNGDILTDLDFGAFYNEHVESKKVFTISSYLRKQLIDYGVLNIDQEQHLLEFKEKPLFEYEVSMGVYMLNREAVQYIPAGRYYGFDNLMLDILNAGEKIKVSRFKGYWLDIGRPDDYAIAVEEFERLRSRFIYD